MKQQKKRLDPNLTPAFAPEAGSRARAHSSATSIMPHFDGDIPNYVFMRATDADPAPVSARFPVRVGADPNRDRALERARALEPDLPEIGSILDKYRIEELLGRGGFAAVYRATHLLLRTPVAIKLLRPKVIQKDPSFAKMLCEEARYAARINHPNVVRVQDVTYTPAITYVVMEFIDGSTLARVIEKSGPLSPERVLRIGLDITSGLRAGYEQGLIHRDIKPANVLITRAGVAKIVDLGLAHPLVTDSSSTSSHSYTSGSAPVSGIANRLPVVGTPAYMAPEQAVNPETVDFRADIYALGVTMFHAATGQIPFPAREPARCLELHRTQPIPRPESIHAAVPRNLADLIVKMMAKIPRDRPTSYDDLSDQMTRILSDLDT